MKNIKLVGIENKLEEYIKKNPEIFKNLNNENIKIFIYYIYQINNGMIAGEELFYKSEEKSIKMILQKKFYKNLQDLKNTEPNFFTEKTMILARKFLENPELVKEINNLIEDNPKYKSLQEEKNGESIYEEDISSIIESLTI